MKIDLSYLLVKFYKCQAFGFTTPVSYHPDFLDHTVLKDKRIIKYIMPQE